MTATRRIPVASADTAEPTSLDIADLREQLALRDQALDATPTFFVITKIGSAEPVIVYCNKAVAEHHGYTREELIGKPVTLLTRFAGQTPEHERAVVSALQSGRAFNFEEEVSRRDGTTFWVGVSLRPLRDSTNEVSHAVAIGADISSKREETRKQRELQDKLLQEMKERERIGIELQLAQKLESVGRLAAGIAHEINTPIQYVGDSVYFLRSAYDDLNRLLDGLRAVIAHATPDAAQSPLNSKAQALVAQCDITFLREEIPKAFERTLDGVKRVSTIVKALKEFAHPDDHEQNVADLNHAIDTTLLVASNEYKYRAAVHTEFADLPPVMCNIGELNQVFLNLIVNAVHAIEDAGRSADSGEITIRTSVDGDAAVIRVADNGCGIAPENLSKLYDPFFTTKEVGRGTGQGLAISHSIVVDKHGGDIEVKSNPGVGTEFILRLPIRGRTRAVSS
jgi:PAS domain S-box-containing protein